MTINKVNYAHYPQHSPRWAPPRKALLVTPEIGRLGLIAEWARSVGCDLFWSPKLETAQIPGWLVVDLDGLGDPDTTRARLSAYRTRHAATQVMLLSSDPGTASAGQDPQSICDVSRRRSLSLDALETATYAMHVNNLAWQARIRSVFSA